MHKEVNDQHETIDDKIEQMIQASLKVSKMLTSGSTVDQVCKKLDIPADIVMDVARALNISIVPKLHGIASSKSYRKKKRSAQKTAKKAQRNK